MHGSLNLALLELLWPASNTASAQTPEDLTKLIERLIDLDSIDLSKGVKFRPGLEPSLHSLDADESAMQVLKNPYEVFGEGKPGAVGWYRVSFVAPEKIGKFVLRGYNLGVESNVQGNWEIYTYLNGKPAGANGGLLTVSNRRPTEWISNAPMPTKAGDKITIAILAWPATLGRGSPEGFALRHLRLRYALGHTSARGAIFGGVSGPGAGTGLLGARERLQTLKGDELKALQDKLKGPLARMDVVFEAAETGQLDKLSKAMLEAAKEIGEAQKK